MKFQRKGGPDLYPKDEFEPLKETLSTVSFVSAFTGHMIRNLVKARKYPAQVDDVGKALQAHSSTFADADMSLIDMEIYGECKKIMEATPAA